jgi:glyoxylase-like metal-dependent hydrolase (beta-lactamase superfamily II)
VAIYFQADGLIAVGDVLSPNRAPSIDYGSGGSLLGIPQALDAILAVDWTIAVPGHGDPVNWAVVESYRMKITTLIARAREAVARGVAKEQLLGQIRIDDLGWQPLQMDTTQLDGYYAEMARR